MKKKKGAIIFCNLVIAFVLFAAFPALIAGQKDTAKTKIINYCSLFDSSKNYEGQIVKSRALMTYSTVSRVDGGDSFLYLPKCNNMDFFAVTNFTNYKSAKGLENFFSKLKPEKNYVFEVILTGRLQTSVIPIFGHLSWSRAEFEIVEINSIKDVARSVVKPNRKAERPLIDKGKSLRVLNSEVAFTFFFRKRTSEIESYLADEFVFVDLSGKSFNQKTYNQSVNEGAFDKEEKFERVSVSDGEVTISKNDYKVSGVINAEDKEGKRQKKISYENTFRYQNDSWQLIEIKFINS